MRLGRRAALSLAGGAARLLWLAEPERAHRLALGALRRWPRPDPPARDDPRLAVEVLGLAFPNPVGLAAGFDKDGETVGPLLSLGFGFVEIGTVTPRPQGGNPRPRLFRLPADRALVNRMGFNNAGADAVAERLAERDRRTGIVGVNVGANRDAEDRIADCAAGVARFSPLADYLVVNVSSPNTPGLRDLQAAGRIDDLLLRCLEARERAAQGKPPLLVKIAPDLDDAALAYAVEAARRHGADGLVVANTTVARGQLVSRRHAHEPGGLSGRPLFARSTAMLARARSLAGPDFALVGVGGVDGPAAAWAKVAAGADLVQLYTGLVYKGPALAARIKAGLLRGLGERGLARLRDARGLETARWADAWTRV